MLYINSECNSYAICQLQHEQTFSFFVKSVAYNSKLKIAGSCLGPRGTSGEGRGKGEADTLVPYWIYCEGVAFYFTKLPLSTFSAENGVCVDILEHNKLLKVHSRQFSIKLTMQTEMISEENAINDSNVVNPSIHRQDHLKESAYRVSYKVQIIAVMWQWWCHS